MAVRGLCVWVSDVCDMCVYVRVKGIYARARARVYDGRAVEDRMAMGRDSTNVGCCVCMCVKHVLVGVFGHTRADIACHRAASSLNSPSRDRVYVPGQGHAPHTHTC